MDILPPPKRPLSRPAQSPVNDQGPVSHGEELGRAHSSKQGPLVLKRPWYRKWHMWVLIVLGLFIVAASSIVVWYTLALQPKSGDEQTVQLIVEDGDTSSQIIDKLATAGLIRSKLATRFYVEMSGNKGKLQAGGYILSPTQSVGDIIDHIVAGKTDEQLVTIPPGRTIKELREDLKKYGYTDVDITAALDAKYNSPLLADKPANATLEGYIYPESFKMNAGEPLEKLFQKSFDELYKKLQSDGMIEKFKSHGLTVYQALTLASIVQKEVSDPATQRQVAQVFYSRLAANMVLGSDVTFEYAAEQLGVTPAVDIDSPYNTRLHAGLPPGPIANMNYTALQAVADPAQGDYLYFVAGDGADQGKTFFSHTVEEHEANVSAHCHDLCN